MWNFDVCRKGNDASLITSFSVGYAEYVVGWLVEVRSFRWIKVTLIHILTSSLRIHSLKVVSLSSQLDDSKWSLFVGFFSFSSFHFLHSRTLVLTQKGITMASKGGAAGGEFDLIGEAVQFFEVKLLPIRNPCTNFIYLSSSLVRCQ